MVLWTSFALDLLLNSKNNVKSTLKKRKDLRVDAKVNFETN